MLQGGEQRNGRLLPSSRPTCPLLPSSRPASPLQRSHCSVSAAESLLQRTPHLLDKEQRDATPSSVSS